MEEKPECQKSKRDIEELKTEEKMLNNYLETLRKENFSLQASIDSWQITLNKKLNQFRESESELVTYFVIIILCFLFERNPKKGNVFKKKQVLY